jgi:hypothetical protein
VLLKRMNSFEVLLSDFVSFFGENFKSVKPSIPLIYEIYERIDQRTHYYQYFHSSDSKNPMVMSQTKAVALMVFWVLKYKPLFLDEYKANLLFNEKNCTINEYFAVYCIMAHTKKISRRPDIMDYFTPKNIDVLVYSFMHRDISKEAMICYVGSLLNHAEA